MAELFGNGRIIDGILGFMLVEIIVLIIIRKRSGRGLDPVDLISGMMAGIALLFALRAALSGQAWPTVSLYLLLSLVAHLIDLARRWTTQ